MIFILIKTFKASFELCLLDCRVVCSLTKQERRLDIQSSPCDLLRDILRACRVGCRMRGCCQWSRRGCWACWKLIPEPLPCIDSRNAKHLFMHRWLAAQTLRHWLVTRGARGQAWPHDREGGCWLRGRGSCRRRVAISCFVHAHHSEQCIDLRRLQFSTRDISGLSAHCCKHMNNRLCKLTGFQN